MHIFNLISDTSPRHSMQNTSKPNLKVLFFWMSSPISQSHEMRTQLVFQDYFNILAVIAQSQPEGGVFLKFWGEMEMKHHKFCSISNHSESACTTVCKLWRGGRRRSDANQWERRDAEYSMRRAAAPLAKAVGAGQEQYDELLQKQEEHQGGQQEQQEQQRK